MYIYIIQYIGEKLRHVDSWLRGGRFSGVSEPEPPGAGGYLAGAGAGAVTLARLRLHLE